MPATSKMGPDSYIRSWSIWGRVEASEWLVKDGFGSESIIIPMDQCGNKETGA